MMCGHFDADSCEAVAKQGQTAFECSRTFLIILTLRPMVGTVSTGAPVAITFSNVVLPLFSRPTNTTSSLREKRFSISLDSMPPMLVLASLQCPEG